GGVAVDGTLPPAPPAPSGVLPAAQPVGDEQREVRGGTLGDPCTRRLRVCPDPVSPLLALGPSHSAEPEVVLVGETGGHLLPVPPPPRPAHRPPPPPSRAPEPPRAGPALPRPSTPAGPPRPPRRRPRPPPRPAAGLPLRRRPASGPPPLVSLSRWPPPPQRT